MSNFKKIVNVIPLTRLALDKTQIFSYLVPLALQGQIRAGQLVRIPLRGRNILGVTSSVEMHRLSREVKRFKPIEELIDPTPVLTEKNQLLADWMAEEYSVSLGIAVKAMIPDLARAASVQEIVGHEKKNPYFVLTEDQRLAMNKIVGSISSAAEFLLYGPPGSGKTELGLRMLERILERDQQAIILIPEISEIRKMVRLLAERFGINHLAILHGKLKNSERMWVWRQIQAREKQIVLGPRSAIFAPVKNLGLIIMEDAHDASYKQSDQHPKYQTAAVARKLTELWQCPLLLTDDTPSIASLWRTSTSAAKLIQLPRSIKADLAFPKVQVIDMRKEQPGADPYFFSEYLKFIVLENIKKRQQVVLFLNKKTDHSIPVCADCGFVPVCEDCSINLVWNEKKEQLICHSCGKTYAFFAHCPKCQGVRIRSSGFDIGTVEDELKKMLTKELPTLSESIRIETVDQQRLKKDSSGEMRKAWRDGQIDVIVGTQVLTSGWETAKVGLVGIISADTLLHFPDYRSNEKTFQILMKIVSLSGKPHKPGSVILQTYNPDNPAIVAVKNNDYENFYKKEIEDRRKMLYPPFCKLVKITVKDKISENALQMAHEIVQKLMAKKSDGMQIIGPSPGFIQKQRGYYNFQIVLKISPEGKTSTRGLLKDISVNFDVDVDPDSLL